MFDTCRMSRPSCKVRLRSKPKNRFSCAFSITLLLAGLIPSQLQAQPSLTYTPYVGARVFAVDGQTNVYANAGGTVFKFNGDGVPLQTNQPCPAGTAASQAQRDAAGNFCFTGTYNPPVNFGGVTLSNGGVFLAKYTAAGSLVWAVGFGPGPGGLRALAVTDLQLDSGSNSYVGYYYSFSASDPARPVISKFDTSGMLVWATNLGDDAQYSIARLRFGPLSTTNGYYNYVVDSGGAWGSSVGRFDNLGSLGGITNWSGCCSAEYYAAWNNARPSANSLGEWYNVENSSFVKRGASGALLWSAAGSPDLFVVGPDLYGGAHTSAGSGNFSRYDYDGNLVWTWPLPSPCSAMVMDANGNRFISLLSGAIARVGPETISAPIITNLPVGLTTFAGSNVVFTVGASGFSPLRYYWLYQGSLLAGPTNSPILNLGAVTSSQSGMYSVIVSNSVGTVTSAPVQLRVKNVAIFLGNQQLTNGAYTFPTPPTLSIRSAYPSGSSYYTLNGSAPTFSSTPYSAPFTLSNSATVRAIGYSADFSQSEEADAVNATVLPYHTLSATWSGGGSVTLNPSGGVYASTNIVTATATPSPGWSFLYWLGDASGSNPVLNITMSRDQAIYAVFGTTLSTTVAGSGSVLLYPGGPYPYGSVVRLSAVPQSGNYFGAWGNAASGNTNPLYFTISAPTQTVSSIFAAVPAGQAALTLLINGPGKASASPRANVYPTNQSVTLTVTPDVGQFFLNWTGDAAGSQNPLTVSMTQSKVITANFGRGGLLVNPAGGDGLGPGGFRFTVVNPTQTVWNIFGSTNLSAWSLVGTVTNTQIAVPFTDPAAVGRPMRFYKESPGP
jgi:hypothetical protein